MCTTGPSNRSRICHRSIISEIKPTDTLELDYISIDVPNHHGSSTLSSYNDASAQPTIICSQHDINSTILSCNNNNISSENIYQRSASFSSESPRPYQRFSRDQLRLPSPLLDHRTNKEEQSIPIISHRSHSSNNLTLPQLRETTTGDSGTGDSMIQLLAETSAKPLHYEIVPVFGQSKVALMANRYEFDPAKVAEYRPRKRNIPGTKTDKFAQTILKTTSKSIRHNSHESKKSNNIFTRFINTLKPSSTNQYYIQPIVRHHSSTNIINDHH